MNKYEGYIFGKVNSLNVSDEDILKWARQDFEAGIMTPDEWGNILREYYGAFQPSTLLNTKDDSPMLYRAKMELESGIMTPDEYTNLYNTPLRANSYGADTKDMKDMIKYRDADVIATEEAYKKFKDDKEKLCEKSKYFPIDELGFYRRPHRSYMDNSMKDPAKHSIADDLNICKWPDHYIIRGSLSADIKTLLDACLDPTVSLDEFRNMITAHNSLLECYRDTSEKEEEATEHGWTLAYDRRETTEATPEKSDEQIISEEMEEDRKKETDALKDTIRMLEFILNEYETAMGTTISDRCRKEGRSH